MRKLGLEHRLGVGAVRREADIIVGGLEFRIVEFQDVTSGIFVDVPRGGIVSREFVHRRNIQAELRQHALPVSAVGLQPVTEGRAADHVEALRAQLVLHRTAVLGDVLEHDDAVFAGRLHP